MISATNMKPYMIIDGLEISPHLLEISELNNFKSGSLIISGVFGDFSGTAKTKLKINCEVHGAGWEWGNQWKPTIAVLKRKGACPKCAGNYRYTEEERVKQLEQLEGIEFKSFEGEYKGNTTPVNVFCHIHKFSWVATLANLLKGTGCSKCSGVYKHSKHERIAQINSLPNLQFISFPDGYKSGKSKALVRCLKDGYEWEVSVTGLIDKGRGCHKCSGSVRVKEDDVIFAIEKNGNVAFVSFPNGYLNSHSRVELNCSHCNLNWDMSSTNAILKPIKCPTCSDVKRIRTKEQALFLLKKLKGMKFLKFTEGFENLDSYVMLACEKSNHTFKIKLFQTQKLSECKICSGHYIYS
jgi:phage FluMu protein Com